MESAGQQLLKVLGYTIDKGKRKTEDKLHQYANFHRYLPHFVKAMP
jgi:hypothetical protein